VASVEAAPGFSSLRSSLLSCCPSTRTLDIYQQPGEEAMLRAIERRKELRANLS